MQLLEITFDWFISDNCVHLIKFSDKCQFKIQILFLSTAVKECRMADFAAVKKKAWRQCFKDLGQIPKVLQASGSRNTSQYGEKLRKENPQTIIPH